MPADTAYHGALADFFAERSGELATNAYIDRPAMLDLAGDVTGLDVLDVGCGSGFYTAALLDRGASSVTGVDGSAAMLEHARRVVGERASLRLHDLELPLDFAADASFDLVVMALVYHHVHDRRQLLAELRRVLRPGGRLLISNTHPTAEQEWLGGSYFSGERIDAPMGGGSSFRINMQRMTLEMFTTEVLAAGFVLERLREPRPVPAMRDIDPERYERRSAAPTILTVELRRPATG